MKNVLRKLKRTDSNVVVFDKAFANPLTHLSSTLLSKNICIFCGKL